jgi:hypothetical protein
MALKVEYPKQVQCIEVPGPPFQNFRAQPLRRVEIALLKGTESLPLQAGQVRDVPR